MKKKKKFRDREGFRNALSGASAGAMASFLTCPLDVVKTRMQNSATPVYSGTFNGLATIFRSEGYRGWYRGLSAMMLGYLPSWAIYFSVYEGSKRTLYAFVPVEERERDENGVGVPLPPPSWVHLSPNAANVLSAMSAGVVSTTATNPLWVVKSRLMTQSAVTSYHYASIRDALSQIYTREGPRGFYKGLGTSLLGVSHAAVHFPLYERIKMMLHTRSLRPARISDLHHREPIANTHVLLASVTSKMIASMITYPHETIRTRLQNQSHTIKYRSIRHCVELIYAEEGFRAFYRGLGTNLFRTLPSAAITLFTYERIARALESWSHP
ncbi:mitochondrial carrier domain-containing protein [Blastocladiella britannica]|nr:mitochondrial carrier domain-containing protein [Blastocladiella britannica]